MSNEKLIPEIQETMQAVLVLHAQVEDATSIRQDQSSQSAFDNLQGLITAQRITNEKLNSLIDKLNK